MGRAVVEPLPLMRSVLLPSNAGWVREGGRRDPHLVLTLHGITDEWNPRYLATLDKNAQRTVADSGGYRSLAAASIPEYDSGLAAFFYVREAAVAAARKAGAQVGGAQRATSIDLVAAITQADTYAQQLAAWVCSGLALPGQRSPDASFTAVIAGRFTTAFLLAFLHHALGTPRGAYRAAEMDSWPVVPDWDMLLVNRHMEGTQALRHPAFMPHLMSTHPTTAAGRENGSWPLVRSFIQDAVFSLAALTESWRAPVVQQSPELWEICRILGTAAAFGDPNEAQAAVAGEMQSVLNANMGHASAPPPPGYVPPRAERAPAPAAYPLGVSPRGAELLCCEWMKHLGITDARVTQFVADGGIDITSAKYEAQVKHYTGPVGAPDIQRFIGATFPHTKGLLFFTSGRYTAQAQDAAATADVALFRYNAESGDLIASNRQAESLVRSLR